MTNLGDRVTSPFRLVFLLGFFAMVSVAQAQEPSEQKALELFRDGKTEDSHEMLKAVVKANPNLPPARVLLSELFFKSGNGQRARQELERASVEDPYHPDVLLLNGSFAAGEGRLTDAILSFEAALKSLDSPRWTVPQQSRISRQARLGLAKTYQSRGDYRFARSQYLEMLKREPKNGPLRIESATAAFQSGLHEVAEKELNAAFEEDKTLDPPELVLARLWNQKKDAEKAEKLYKEASKKYPVNAKVARNYVEWLLEHGRCDETTPLIETCLKIDGKSQESIAIQGLTSRYRKDYAKAEELFEKLHRDSPGNAVIGWHLALVLVELEDKKKKERGLELAEALSRQFPREVEGLMVLGWCYFKNDRVIQARQAIEARLKTGIPLSPDNIYFVVKIFENKGDLNESLRLLKAAVGQPGPFVYRKDAEVLVKELEKKVPKSDSPKNETEPKKP